MKSLCEVRVFTHTGVALVGATICTLCGLLAPPAGAANAKPVIDPHADELLKRMGDYLHETQFFSVHIEVWQDIDLASGQRLQTDRIIELQVRRPDRLRAEVDSARRHRELVYDGKALTLFNRADKFYGTVRTSSSLDAAMDLASERFGINMPLEDFIRSDPHKDLLNKAASGADLGAVTVLGVPCEHLAFTQDDIDWQLWIENGAKPVPRKFVITYKDELNCPQFTAIFSNWDFETKLPDFVFQFEPPTGAMPIKIKEMRAEMRAGKKEGK